MLAIYLYPPLATIVINYGPNAILKLLNDTSLMCTLTELIRRKPTNPKDIFEVMFKAKVSFENHKNKKIKKFIEEKKIQEEKEFKKHCKKNPPSEFIKTIFSHQKLSVDSRIPVSDDFKLKLKNINFKKYYIDLFLYDFDKTSCIFYGIMSNASVFESFETFNEFAEKHSKEDVVEISNYFHVNYQLRRDLNSKLNYKNINHIFKISKSHNEKNQEKTYIVNHIAQTYMDTISMMLNMEIDTSDIFKCKNTKELNDMHNAISQSYKLTLDKKSTEELKKHLLEYRKSEGIIDGVKFELLDTPEKFYEESKVMNHCVQSYCKHTSEGRFVIYSIEDVDSKERATLSINRTLPFGEQALMDKVEYSFNQLKAKNNKKSSEKIISAAKKLCSTFFDLKNINSGDLTPGSTTENGGLFDMRLNQFAPIAAQNNNNLNELNNYLDELPF
ncbi:MAG TPA: PcfJ domain-containing protein [Candidatus Paceibacterota bacterium]|nr:PcfJ domain-containing protein [Candidatus Paceibacterota bacterium]